MLLRTEYSGRLIDIRIHDRWAIGSEVLLSYGENSMSSDTDFKPPQFQSLDSRSDICRVVMKASFSQTGSKNAKEYFERLILQYPHRKVLPNALGECELNVTMFNLWIYSIQEQYMIRQRDPDPAFEIRNVNNQANDKERVEAYGAILSEANEVILRLDELLLSPPYSDNHRLWNLLGMVALWKVHLLSHVHPSQGDLATGDIEEHSLSPGASLFSRQKEIMQRARNAFIQVSRLGGCVRPVLKDDQDW